MGASKSKVRGLNPKTVKELQTNIDVDFTREEIEEWFREYQSSLGHGQKKLTEKEFRVIYNTVFDGDANDFVKHLFRSFDSNNDGYVDFKEFIVGLCVSGSDKVVTKLKWAFRMYDIDGNGFITKDEMTGMLKEILSEWQTDWILMRRRVTRRLIWIPKLFAKAIYRMVSTDPSNAEEDMKTMEGIIADFFDNADKNKDNAISQEEFVDGVKSMPVILDMLQCDPEPEAQHDQFVSKFDELEVSSKSTEPSECASGESERMKSYKASQKD